MREKGKERMQIVYKNIDELTPYAKNPRRNDKAVDAVAESIRQFGMKVPCVIDVDGVLITGHTRIKACQKLGIKEIPCIVADDLTEEQVKAFRLADNKVAELADWDYDLLAQELAEIDLDMDDFGFDTDDILFSDDEPYDAREHNEDVLRLANVDIDETEGKWQMPILAPTDHVPTELIPFHWAYPSTTKPEEYRKGVHFYIYDWLFERFWNRPQVYLDKLAKFDCCLTPDFSLYLDMPLAQQIWNVYRSRVMGVMMQSYGITVIPTLTWSNEQSYEFCFDGIPKHSVVSVSTVGVMRSEEGRRVWVDGMNEAIRRLNPSCVVAYGKKIEYEFPCKVVYINTTHEELSE